MSHCLGTAGSYRVMVFLQGCQYGLIKADERHDTSLQQKKK